MWKRWIYNTKELEFYLYLIFKNKTKSKSKCSVLFIEIVGVIKMIVKRGDMFYADLSPVIGSEQGGIRPVVIIQNDVGNKHSPTVIAAAITSQTGKNKLPTHIEIDSKNNGLKADSVVLTEQIRTIDKSRLKEKIGHIDDAVVMSKINNALGVSFRIIVKKMCTVLFQI